ncbi:MAG: DUF58 domain-containing protein [Planctomycetota bacterium]
MAVSRRTLQPPDSPRPFTDGFRALLPRLCATRGTIDAGRAEHLRARRALLSQSGTFVGHRPYERGDDLRHLDWAAYARTGELYIKQLQEEDRRAVTVVLDLSPRLLCGDPPRRLGMLRLAAVIGSLALTRLDGVAIVAPHTGLANARFTGQSQLGRLLQHLEALPFAESQPAQAAALAMHGDAIQRVHWISDFARPTEFVLPLLQLRRRGIKVTGWVPSIVDDDEPPASGYLQVADPVSGEALSVPIDAELRSELRRQLQRLRRQQDRMFAETGALLRRWPFAESAAIRGGADVVAQPRLQDHLPIVAACSR